MTVHRFSVDPFLCNSLILYFSIAFCDFPRAIFATDLLLVTFALFIFGDDSSIGFLVITSIFIFSLLLSFSGRSIIGVLPLVLLRSLWFVDSSLPDLKKNYYEIKNNFYLCFFFNWSQISQGGLLRSENANCDSCPFIRVLLKCIRLRIYLADKHKNILQLLPFQHGRLTFNIRCSVHGGMFSIVSSTHFQRYRFNRVGLKCHIV